MEPHAGLSNGASVGASASLRTLVVGLSGCSWSVLDPLLESGELPHLASMRERAATATLQSVVPFESAPAWATYATGAQPATHGVYDHVAPDSEGRLRPVRAQDLRCRTYYQQLGRAGKRCVLINLPIDQNGAPGSVIVNSWLTIDEERRILPLGRRERYRRLLESYRVLPSSGHDLDELCAIEEARFDLARELYLREDWDHFFVLFSATDWLGHVAMGRFLAGADDARSAFVRLYRQLDAYVGWLVEHAQDAVVFVLSEHGQAEEQAILRVNTVLEQLGLLETLPLGASNGAGSVARRGAQARARVTVPAPLAQFRGNPFVRPLALATRSAARTLLGVQLTSPVFRVDPKSSRAYSPTDASYAIYARDASERDIESIVRAVESISLDGRPAVNAIYRTEDLWGRSRSLDEPVLIFAPTRGVRPSAAIKDRAIDFPAARGQGCHDREGVLLVAGPGVSQDVTTRASLCDIAPTLLWLMREPLAEEMDGRVLESAFDPTLAMQLSIDHVSDSTWRVGFPASTDESDEVTQRLEALGYI